MSQELQRLIERVANDDYNEQQVNFLIQILGKHLQWSASKEETQIINAAIEKLNQ